MTEALRELIEKVEAGAEITGRDVHLADTGHSDHIKLTLSAYGGSLDAAKDLHKAVLPGWTVRLVWCDDPFAYPYAHTFKRRARESDPTLSANSAGTNPSTPACAVLIAILRALAEGSE